jgi:hypothetical protein
MVLSALILSLLGPEIAHFNAVSQLHRMGYWGVDPSCLQTTAALVCNVETDVVIVSVHCSMHDYQVCNVHIREKK